MKQAQSSGQQARNRASTSTANIIVWTVAALAVLAVGLVLLNRGGSSRETEPVATVSGDDTIAPDFSLPTLDGGTASLAGYRGSVVLLNFWATWCGPCKREIPDFNELQKEYGERGFSIVGIALDDADAVREFHRAQPLQYPVLIGDMTVARAYGGVSSIPTSFLLDRDGRILDMQVGLKSKEYWSAAIEAALEG